MGVDKGWFLSLKLKIFVILILVLIAVQGLYALFSFYQLESQFELQRQQANSAEMARLNGSLQGSYRRLLEVAELLPLIDAEPSDEQISPLVQLTQVINRKFDAFQLTGSVNAAYLYDGEARLVGFWGDKMHPPEAEIREVYATERPLRKLTCSSVCTRYVLIPILLEGEKQGVLLVARSLDDVIYDIKQQTTRDIGVALIAPISAGELGSWGLLLSSMTNRSVNQTLLETLAREQSFNDAGGEYRLKTQGREYEILLTPLAGVAEGSAYWVVIDDISSQLQVINTSLVKYLIVGMAGISIAIILLAILFKRPFDFFVLLARQLPLLSRSEYQKFRSDLSKQHGMKWLGYDERDLLVSSALHLTDQLEVLEGNAVEQRDHLEVSRQVLSKERDSLLGLLETAPLLILTQTAQGQLKSLNHFGLQIMDMKPEQVKSISFLDFLQRDNEKKEFSTQSQRLLCGLEKQVRTDSMMLDHVGNHHDISWLHARMRQVDGEEPLILSMGMDISDRKRTEQRLHWLANHDPLTERPNRLLFMNRLHDAIEDSRAQDTQVSILFIYLDRFKEVNDSLGHSIGDRLLKVATKRIHECIRDTDTLARLGSDEFTVLLDSVRNLEGAEVVASKILEAFQQPFWIGEYEVVVTVSIGISLFPDHAQDGVNLIKHADVAMCQAKDAGKNCYFVYDVEKDHQRYERFALGADLGRAIQNDELVLHYQPQYDAVSGCIVGVEALVRWQHPVIGMLPPERFIPLAEELDLIFPLGEWVLRTACFQMKAWQRAGFPKMKVAVDLAGQQIAHERLISSVQSALIDAELEADWLELEVVENFVIRQPEVAIGKLTYLHDMGVTLVLDDFGTGYTSLSYLQQLPIDKLKLDRGFVQGIGVEKNDEAIIKATLAMCHSLGLDVVAEGVDTREQINFLLRYRCNKIQGYFYGKPLPPEELMAVVREQGVLTIPA